MSESVIILKWDGETQVEQDVTQYYDGPHSNFATQTWLHRTGSTLVLKIHYAIQLGLVDGVDPIDLTKLLEIWVGVRDEDDVFDSTGVLFGGYLGPKTVTVVGDDVVYTIQLFSYTHDLLTKNVTSWPMDITLPISTTASTDDPTSAIIGYPPSYSDVDPDHAYSVFAWIGGTIDPGGFPYDGIIPAHYQRMYLTHIAGSGPGTGGGIRGAFSDIHFNWGTKPRNTSVNGFFAAATVDDVLKEIIRTAAYVAADPANGLDPIQAVYWVRAIVDPDDSTRLRPQFCLYDLNSPDAVQITFSDDPGEGEESYEDLEISDDPTDYGEVTEVFGLGTEIILEGEEPTPKYRLVYARSVAQTGSHTPIVPAPYHKRRPDLTGTDGPGSWEAPPRIEPRLETKEQAIIAAAALVAATQNERKSYALTCDVWVEEGMVIRIKRTKLALDVQVTVLEVDKQGYEGFTRFKIKAGYVDPTPEEVLNDQAIDLITLRHPSPYSSTYTYYSAGTSIPNTNNNPQNDPLNSYSQRNLSQPERDSVVGAHFYAAQNRRNAMANGIPLNPDGYPAPVNNEFDTPLPTPVTLPAVAPAPNAVAWGVTVGGGTIPQAWFDANNNVHPVEWGRDFYDNGWQPVTLPAPAAITTAIVKVEYADDGTVFGDFVNANTTGTITLTLKRTVLSSGAVTTFDSGDISAATPMIVDYTHSLIAIIAGLPAGHVVNVFLSEREPDASVFGGPAPSDTP